MTDGWKCPVCNRGVAPGEKACDHGGSLAAPYHFTHPGCVPTTVYPSPQAFPLHPYWSGPTGGSGIRGDMGNGGTGMQSCAYVGMN